MHRFIRWYNQNIREFWIIFAIIALIFIVIQVLNGLVKEENEQKRKNMNLGNSSTNQSTTISNSNTSVITGDEISDKTARTNEDVIKEFVNYCNRGETEKAYNMLSDECKKLIYPDVQYFMTNYYQRIFYINRMYKLENWYQNGNLYTYHISYTEDVLATGNVNSEDNKADYITVVKNKDGYKLNISNYVGREIHNRASKQGNIQIMLNWIDMYMDYTITNFSIKNSSNNTVCLDTKTEPNTLYLYDENSVKYTSLLNENALEELIIGSGMTNTVNIKFKKIYNPGRELYGVVFSNIIANYEEYISQPNNKKVVTINVEL